MNCQLLIGLALSCFVPQTKCTKAVKVIQCTIKSNKLLVEDLNNTEQFEIDQKYCIRIGQECKK